MPQATSNQQDRYLPACSVTHQLQAQSSGDWTGPISGDSTMQLRENRSDLEVKSASTSLSSYPVTSPAARLLPGHYLPVQNSDPPHRKRIPHKDKRQVSLVRYAARYSTPLWGTSAPAAGVGACAKAAYTMTLRSCLRSSCQSATKAARSFFQLFR